MSAIEAQRQRLTGSRYNLFAMQRLPTSLLLSLIAFALQPELIAQTEHQHQRLSQKYVSRECGVQFNYPVKWQVWAGKKCDFKLHPEGTSIRTEGVETNDQAIMISVSRNTLLEVAKDSRFEVVDGKWMLNGEGQVQVDPIDSPYKGLMVTDFPCRFYDENGYVGMGDCARAVLAHRMQAASFYANPGAMELLPAVVSSFRFVPTMRSAGSRQNPPK